MLQPVRVIEHFRGGPALGAQHAVVDRTLGIAFDGNNLSIFDMHLHTAAGKAHAAGAFNDFFLNH
jgi:hypothetical protein